MHTVERAIGLPAGGATGQVPQKASARDFDAVWVDPVTQENVANAAEEAVLEQRFDYLALINSTLSI